MCGENNDITNTIDCSCLNELLTNIIKLQKKDSKCCNQGGCDKPFLGPTPNLVCYNTRPVNFYNCQTGALWTIDYTFNGTTGTSSVFRCEDIDDCCCTCRILIDNGDNNYAATNQFFIINLNCVSAIKCLPDSYVDIC
ncbi:MAG: hypothetical protein IKO49_04160 [Bacilli bacterium]|nr:hypothetical protein [Bacilli bacterium]